MRQEAESEACHLRDKPEQDYAIFGHNDPALHHYHEPYREAHGLPPLELIQD